MSCLLKIQLQIKLIQLMTAMGVHGLTVPVETYTATTQVGSQKCHNWSQRDRGTLERVHKLPGGSSRKSQGMWEEEGERIKVRKVRQSWFRICWRAWR